MRTDTSEYFYEEGMICETADKIRTLDNEIDNYSK